MDDKMKETISALIDNEASEIELQRVLSRVSDAELNEVWSSYYKIRDVIQGDQRSMVSIDVRAGVMAAIENEMPAGAEQINDTTIITPSAETRRHNKPWLYGASMAIAASAILAVVVNLESLWQASDLTELQSNAVAQASNEELQPRVITDMDSQNAKRFTKYLLRHSELSTLRTNYGMMPLVRVASINSVGI
jgi:negative regulator of sigma E activity